jgi:hypothetical protein
MCGPGDRADDLRLHAEVAERLDEVLGRLGLAGGVGRSCSALERCSSSGRGIRHSKSGSSVMCGR